MRFGRIALLSFSASLLVACIEKEKPVDDAYVKANLLVNEPTPKLAVNADLGGKVVYLGMDVDKPTARPGDTITMVHYWKVVQAPGEEYRAFTHVKGATGKDWINADGTKMRTNHGPERWKAGEIVRDEQTITLKKEWTGPAVVHVGLYKRGSSNPKDRLVVASGPADGEGGVVAARITVEGKPVEGPRYLAWKATAAPKLDGKGDDAAWASAPWTPAFVDAQGSPAVGKDTRAKLVWDDQNLYALIEVQDGDVSSQFDKHDDPLWKEDVVELFIDADKNRRGYVELQVNPRNAHFDSFFSGGNRQGADPSFDAKMTSAVVVDGTVNDDKDDKSWTVEVAIPLVAVKGKDEKNPLVLPPAVGASWKLNFVRVEKQGKGIAASSWAPITYQDFHAIDRLGEVVFADATGAIPAPAAPTSMPSAVPAKP